MCCSETHSFPCPLLLQHGLEDLTSGTRTVNTNSLESRLRNEDRFTSSVSRQAPVSQLMTVPQLVGLQGWVGSLCCCWGGAPACMLVTCSRTHSQGPCGFLQGEVFSPRRTGTVPTVAPISVCPCGYWVFVGVLQPWEDRTTTPLWTRSMGNYEGWGCRCLVRF